ncbi:hypothetical protein [Chryseobacterium kwangjuense]|uniref:Uncharacterized protein n=1 Tax=Chryseobacterium kwangjuense TaxID=267125 RepID=A0A135WKL0_9FLAO|nr:hypothetical protein [Chryseobacterium kwangjuense]KXH85448.1 hypothetical protein AU378_06790 [Chryseobacterium kwangjuense]
MKKILLSLIVGLSAASVNAQINIPSTPQETIVGENAFMDASPYSPNNGWTASESKGLAFPETDLTQFRFKTDNINPSVAATAYNGMIVYNTATGTTADPAITTQTSGLQPGFYYFSNPTGSSTFTVTAGRWLPLGASPKVTIGTAETTTNTLINTGVGVDKQLYAMKGTFTASGTSTAVNIPAPAGMTTLYGITIYKAGTNTVYDRSLYSYTVATSAGNAITGSPSMSVVYPSGTYDYVIEYLK